MRNFSIAVAGLLGIGALVWLAHQDSQPPVPDTPPSPVKPAPVPRPKPCPPGPYSPWGVRSAGSLPASAPGQPVLGGPVAPDGTTEIKCHMPPSERKRNVGGRDGSGLCVFTSIEYCARWQCERALFDFQAQMRKELGGGWPEKVDKMIARYAPGTAYLQHTGGDPGVLTAALASGRMVGVTYGGYDPHYRGYVAHMVTLVHYDGTWACIIDNNFPGENEYVWMSPAEFQRRWKMGGGGWAVVLLSPPPPPVPRNVEADVTSGWAAPEWPSLFHPKTCPCSPACTCGCSQGQPCKCGNPATLAPNYGLARLRIPQRATYRLSGREITEADALRLFHGDTLPQDQELGRLTVIGDEARCRQVRDDLARHPALAPYRDQVLVHDYRPDEWPTRVGFVTSGSPTLYLQSPTGHVLHRQDRYDGPDALAAVLAKALRRPRPDYDPARDPDLTRSPLLDFEFPPWSPYAAGGVAALFFLLLLRSKN